MKKLVILVMVLSMLLTGCAAVRSFLNSAPVGFVCSPSEAQRLDAEKMLAALDAAQKAGAIFFPALGIAQASAVLKVIQAGGCFLVAELKSALEAVDAANAAQLKAKGPSVAGAVALPEYSSLRVLVK